MGARAFPLVRGAPSAPTARPGKRKGLIGLQLNSTYKRQHKKPRRAATQIVEPAGLRALRVPGEKWEGAARPASDRWMDARLPRPARGGRPHQHLPTWFKFILGRRELEQEVFSLSCALAGCSFAPPGER